MNGHAGKQDQGDYPVTENCGEQGSDHRQRHQRYPYTVQGSVHAVPV